MKATSVGNVITKFVTNCNETEVELKYVFFVKEMDRNLMRFGKITDKAKIVSVGNTSKIYTHENELIAVANKKNNLYKIRSIVGNKQNYLTENQSKGMTLKEK